MSHVFLDFLPLAGNLTRRGIGTMAGYENLFVKDINKVGDGNSGLSHPAAGYEGAREITQVFKTNFDRTARNTDLSQFPNLEISGSTPTDGDGMKHPAVMGDDADGGMKHINQAADQPTGESEMDREDRARESRLSDQGPQNPEADMRFEIEGIGLAQSRGLPEGQDFARVVNASREVLESRYCDRPGGAEFLSNVVF
jgi:hypothetical protein